MIATWKPPASQARDASVKQVSDALKAYSPGGKPGGGMLIDGGGFQIVDDGSKSGYFRAMYESLKNGYIDDLELFVGEDGKSAQVRSSSRVGFLDFGVNSKRLNLLSEELRKAGWEAAPISKKSHPNYCYQNAAPGDGAGCDL